jgi:hypothetical protein
MIRLAAGNAALMGVARCSVDAVGGSVQNISYCLAHEPKRLQLYQGAGHGLEEVAEEVEHLVYEWLVTSL